MLAVISANDRRHRDCAMVLEQESELLLPSVILTELAYMVVRDVGRGAFIHFMRSVLSDEIKLIFPTTADIERALELFEQYSDSRVDFVDCAVTAMAERLNIVRVLTVDQRDFRIMRPRNVAAFEILP